MQKIAIGDFGCIFAGLESLLLKQTDIAPSNSEMFLKLLRSIDPATKSDSTLASKKYDFEHAFFRKVRDESITESELLSRFHAVGLGITSEHLNHLNDVPSNEQGAWCLIHSIIVGMKVSSLSDPVALKYLDFLLAHCQIERDLIKTLRAKNHQSVKNELSLWILLDSDHIGSDHAHHKVNYLAALIFYWAALYEKLLQIEHPDMDWAYTENQNPSLLLKYLPKLDDKGTKLTNSTWCFIEDYKKYLPSKGKKKIFDTDLYAGICKALTTKNYEPNQEAIERNLKKIKRGESPLTIKVALEQLVPLAGQKVPPDYHWDASLMIIHFLNLFATIQIAALNSGLTNAEVVELFECYPRYVDSVHSRLLVFEKTGTLLAS
jgi:hypothetical protein